MAIKSIMLVMNLKEKVKSLLASKALTMTYVAQEISKKRGRKFSLTNFSMKLKKETLTYKELKYICDIAGFEIEIKEKP